MRGVTSVVIGLRRAYSISTRTPHAGSDVHVAKHDLLVDISTRTPHAGSDDEPDAVHQRVDISTRTPHAGSDRTDKGASVPVEDFNPHSPCGE